MRVTEIRPRALDGKVEVWERLQVTWGAERYPDWVLVAVFSTMDEARAFRRNKALAPRWAGDGSGASLASTACTSSRNE